MRHSPSAAEVDTKPQALGDIRAGVWTDDLGEEITEHLAAGGKGAVFVDCLGFSPTPRRHRMKMFPAEGLCCRNPLYST